jgi:outer membrane murein-binding lipoprotein Lpp
MDYAGLTPTLTAAVKELIAKVETLESEVAALKGS